jgi:ubiquitin fusion degradation protein 1
MPIDPRTWSNSLSPEAVQAIIELVCNNPPDQAHTALKTCAKLLKNVASDVPRFGTLKSSAKGLNERLLAAEGGEAAVIALGFHADVDRCIYTWSSPSDAGSTLLGSYAISAAAAICEALRDAIAAVGDSNTPSKAHGALALMCTYVTNVLGDASNDKKRRIGAANPALCSQLLAPRGGPELLRAAGFAPEPVSGPIAFVCASDVPTLRLVLATLSQAGTIWQALAQQAAAAAAASSSGAAGPSAPPAARQESKEPGAMEGVWAALLRGLSSSCEPSLHDRRGDKILLPPSALEAIAELTMQRHGTSRLPNPLVLRLSHGHAARNVGVLQFTAPEGHVIVPDWLLGRLGCHHQGDGDPPLLRVSSVDVPRASMITLRPLLTRFHLADDPQAMLQLGLHGVYTTLHRGETIRIADLTSSSTPTVGRADVIDLTGEDSEGDNAAAADHGVGADGDVELLVGDLWSGEPRNACDVVLIVDIEALVVDLGESCEGERERLASEERQRQQEAAVAEAMEEGMERERRAEAAAAAAAAAAVAADAASSEAFRARQADLRDRITAEPPPPPAPASTSADGGGLLPITALVVRLPDGGSLRRRFEHAAPLRQVREWVEAMLPSEERTAIHGNFYLASTHPRFISCDDNSALTLEAAGLALGQVALHFQRGGAPMDS